MGLKLGKLKLKEYFSLSEMRIPRYIAFFFCLTLVYSCTKPDDDSPSSVVPSSITDESFRDFDYSDQELIREDDSVVPVFINDDGDDESGPSDSGAK